MKHALFILLLLPAWHTRAQVIKPGPWAKGPGSQGISQSCIDREGNLYQILGNHYPHTGQFALVDSAGLPVQLSGAPGGNSYYSYHTALVKYNRNGIYQYHIMLPVHSLVANIWGHDLYRVSLLFDRDNNLYINCTLAEYSGLASPDTLLGLYHANGTLFRTVCTGKNSAEINMGNHPATLLCKISPEGMFQWVTRITSKATYNAGMYNALVRQQTPATISDEGEITLYYDNYWPDRPDHDTITITSNNDQVTKIAVSQRELLLRFSGAGDLISCREPYRNRLAHAHKDTLGEGFHRMISNGRHTYSLHRFYAPVADTFGCSTPVPLEPGMNFLLIKSDKNDSIEWARSIGVDDYAYPFYSYYLDLNEEKNELLYAMQYYPGLFRFTHNSALSYQAYDTDIYLSRLNASDGSVKWEKVFRGSLDDAVNAFTYNKKTNELLLLGRTTSPDLLFDTHLLTAHNGIYHTYFISTIDSNNTISYARTINGWMAMFSDVSIGYPVTDAEGRSYLSGWYYDSIRTSCGTMINSEPSNGSLACDGFTILVDPLALIDTGVCKTLRSPSGRYTWSASGRYYDTIPDHKGCDSVLLFRLQLLHDSSSLDTGVCDRLLSPGGKYTWTEPGTYRDTLVNSHGCDSIVTVRLSILRSQGSFDTTVLRSFRSPGNRYTWDSSGTYSDTILNAAGCDSVITIHLTVLQTSSTLDTAVCDSLLSPSSRYVYRADGSYSDTIPNAAGADSVISIRVKVLRSYASITASSCDTFLSPSGRHRYISSGIYTDTLVNSSHCDSIITIGYHRLVSSSQLTITVCDSLVSPSGRFVYTANGTYTDTIPNASGCDSLVTITLQVIPPSLALSKTNDISCDTPVAKLMASGASHYRWTPAYGLSNNSVADPFARPDTTTLYRVTAYDNLGCSITDSILLEVSRVEPQPVFANVFTPDGDGINDCFILSDSLRFGRYELQIFNRWGALVFISQRPSGCWNGNDAAGNPLPAGVYYYVLDGVSVCDRRINRSGTVTLIR